jgi:hypothetical protein
MNKHTPPMNPVESRETPEAVTATEPIAAPEAEARTVTAEEAENTVPDAVKQSDTSRRAVEDKLASARARGVEWVRASDLLSRGTGRMAGVGIRLHQTAGARTQRGLTSGVRAVSRRVRELPPVSAFGRRAATASAATRSGVGMR